MKYGRYQILKVLGRGSMGVVYQAHDPQIDRLVALKVLREDRLSSESIVQRFLKEAKVVGRLSHSGIVTVYDVGQDQGTVYIAMEYVEGEPLSDLIQKRRLTLKEIVELGVQVVEALDYAHSKGVIHRDIKPSNLLIKQDGSVKITDFGIAHLEDPSSTHQTQAGELLGTPAYMSPEQVMSRPVDGRSDLYSMGVILYELSTGERPFKGQSITTVLRAITEEDPTEPRRLEPSLSEKLSQIIMRCLNKAPERRFATGNALSVALKDVLDQKVPEPGGSRRLGPTQWKRVGLALSLLILAVIIGGGAYHIHTYWKSFGKTGSSATQSSVPTQGATVAPSSLTADAKNRVSQSPSGSDGSGESKGQLHPSALQGSQDALQTDGEQQPGGSASTSVTLNVESTPVGASVIVDGESRGNTPISLNLPAGKHEVKVDAAQYYDWAAQVTLQGGILPLNVKLLPKG